MKRPMECINGCIFELKFGNNRLATGSFVAKLHGYFCIKRQENIYARSEFDEPEFSTLFQFLTFVNVAFDSSRQRTGNLSEKNFYTVIHFRHNRGAFIFCA